MSSIFARAVIDATLIKPSTKGCGAFVELGVLHADFIYTKLLAC